MLGIVELYSKRNSQKNENDIYQYDELPQKLKVQIKHIFDEVIEHSLLLKYKSEMTEIIYKIILKEYGLLYLINVYELNKFNIKDIIFDYFLKNEDIDKSLDIIELFFKLFTGYFNNSNVPFKQDILIIINQAIEELNQRFIENSVGFTFKNKQIIRIDNTFLHSEVVLPTLNFLNNSIYENANKEFMSGFEHYKNSKYKECLSDCLKAFESTIMIILDRHEIAFNKSDKISKHIELLFQNSIIPAHLSEQFKNLLPLLSTSIATIRNKNAGHGQGVSEVIVPKELASYMLHLTATNILFLVENEKNV